MTCVLIVEPTFEENLKKLGMIIDKHQDRQSLVGHDSMKALVLQTVPGLYTTLLNSISSERHGEKKMNMQERRVTSLIWHLLYFR